MIEPRLYRAAFLPAALAVVLAAFSLQERPAGRVADASADVLFDGAAAADQAREIAERFPSRPAGSAADQEAAEFVSAELSLRGFDVVADRFSEGGAQLVNVVGTRSGASRDRLVVMAPRDAASPEPAGSAADTAALLQLATALEGQATEMTVVLVSYDGGEAGVRRFVETVEDRSRLRHLLALSNLGAPPPERPGLVGWSQNLRLESIGLARTAAEALRRETLATAPPPNVGDQLAHLVFPLGIGPQGLLLAEGYSATRFSGTGLLAPTDPASEEIDSDRLGALGKAVLQTLAAIDDGPPLEHGPDTYVSAGRVVLPGWAVSLLALALIAPALVAAVDAAARARRMRQALLPWAASLGRVAAAFLAGAVLALLLGLAIGPDHAGSPPAPGEQPFGLWPALALVLVGAAAAATWFVLRPLGRLRDLARERGDTRAGGIVVSLALAVLALAIWLPLVGLGNPFAALAVAVPLHLWMVALLAPASTRTTVIVGLFAAGLVPALLVIVYYLVELGLDPVSGAWYLLQLVGSGAVDVRATLALALFAALATATLALVVARARRQGATPAL